MCGGIGWGIGSTVLGCILVIVSCVISFVVIPNVVENTIIGQTVLEDDTVQLERFENIPFPLTFNIRIFNLSNENEFLAGEVPVMNEIGPYVYKLHQTREIVDMEADTVNYLRHEYFEFDAEASYPLTEDDIVSIINVPYHAVIQIAETRFPQLLSILNLALASVYGQFNTPVATLPIRQLLFDGIPLCVGNVGIVGNIVCNLIRTIGADAQNLELQEDGSLRFSILNYKNEAVSSEFKVFRGLEDHNQLGEIITYNHTSHLSHWVNHEVVGDIGPDQVSVCNQINGTDSSIYAPLVDTNKPLYALNTDICRSVELRYERDAEYEEIPAVRYAVGDWFLKNDEGCFCLNVTTGITGEDGCMLEGAIELYSCVGAFLVLSYPHFLFADERYREGVIGMNPVEDDHKIFLEIEPNTGTPLRGFKRAQFNIFARQIRGVSATNNISTALVPIMWFEEGLLLPEHLVDELKTRLLSRLRTVNIVIPIIISISAAVLLLGIVLIILIKRRKSVDAVLVSQ